MGRPMEPDGKNAAGPQEDRSVLGSLAVLAVLSLGCLTSFSFSPGRGYKMVASSFTSHVMVLAFEWGLLPTSAQRLQCEVQSLIIVM